MLDANIEMHKWQGKKIRAKKSPPAVTTTRWSNEKYTKQITWSVVEFKIMHVAICAVARSVASVWVHASSHSRSDWRFPYSSSKQRKLLFQPWLFYSHCFSVLHSRAAQNLYFSHCFHILHSMFCLISGRVFFSCVPCYPVTVFLSLSPLENPLFFPVCIVKCVTCSASFSHIVLDTFHARVCELSQQHFVRFLSVSCSIHLKHSHTWNPEWLLCFLRSFCFVPFGFAPSCRFRCCTVHMCVSCCLINMYFVFV